MEFNRAEQCFFSIKYRYILLKTKTKINFVYSVDIIMDFNRAEPHATELISGEKNAAFSY